MNTYVIVADDGRFYAEPPHWENYPNKARIFRNWTAAAELAILHNPTIDRPVNVIANHGTPTQHTVITAYPMFQEETP